MKTVCVESEWNKIWWTKPHFSLLGERDWGAAHYFSYLCKSERCQCDELEKNHYLNLLISAYESKLWKCKVQLLLLQNFGLAQWPNFIRVCKSEGEKLEIEDRQQVRFFENSNASYFSVCSMKTEIHFGAYTRFPNSQNSLLCPQEYHQSMHFYRRFNSSMDVVHDFLFAVIY